MNLGEKLKALQVQQDDYAYQLFSHRILNGGAPGTVGLCGKRIFGAPRSCYAPSTGLSTWKGLEIRRPRHPGHRRASLRSSGSNSPTGG
jgi:hypothetical protein